MSQLGAMPGYDVTGYPPGADGMYIIVVQAPAGAEGADWRSAPRRPRFRLPPFHWRGFVQILCVLAIVGAVGYIAYGVIVSQVFPYERSIAKPIIKEALEASRTAGVELTPTVVEGYVSAKVLVEGLRHAGPKPTRASLRQALEGMSHYDIGGIELGYSPADHTGLEYVDLSIVDQNGRFRR